MKQIVVSHVMIPRKYKKRILFPEKSFCSKKTANEIVVCATSKLNK